MKRSLEIAEFGVEDPNNLEKFCELSNEERCAVLEAQAIEIKKLKKQIRKYKINKGLHYKIEKAKQKLKKFSFELEDQKHILENTIKVLMKSKAKSLDFRYNLIESITEGCTDKERMTITNPSDHKKEELTSEQLNPILFYNLLLDPYVDKIFKDHLVNCYLLTQAILIKEMNFQQFFKIKE